MKRNIVMVLVVCLLLQCFGITGYGAAKTSVMLGGGEYNLASNGLRTEMGYTVIQSDNWVEYTFNAAEGEYMMTLFAGNQFDAEMNFIINNSNAFAYTAKQTGTYSNITENYVGTVMLVDGKNTVRVSCVSRGIYYDGVRLDPLGSDDSSFAKDEGAFRNRTLPTVIEAEDYDIEAQKSFSVDGTNSGDAKKYRTYGNLDLYKNTDGKGYYLALAEDEYATYTFDAVESMGYDLFIYATAGASVKLYFDGQNMPIDAVLKRGENYVNTVYLEEGKHSLKIYSAGDSSLDYIRFATGTKDYYTPEQLANLVESKEETVNPVYKNLYVSLDGNDSGDGSEAAPFATITRAKEEAKALSQNMTGDIVINIAPGTYTLKETEKFTAENSGKNGFNIIYRGTDKDNSPVISGGRKIEGWEKADEYIWKAPLEFDKPVRNLYINGYPAIKARSKYVYRYEAEYDVPGNPYVSDGITLSAANFPKIYTNPDEVELVWNLEWASQRTMVEDIVYNEDGTVSLSMQQPRWNQRHAGNTTTPLVGTKFFIENAFELLDEPGEYYYDSEKKEIYYYPYREENMTSAEAYIAEIEGLVDIAGDGLENRVKNLVFDNLDFRYGAWNLPSYDGFVTRQADEAKNLDEDNSAYLLPAQFTVNYAENIKVLNSTFTCLGSSAIGMVEGVKNAEFEGNLFRDISATGISIGRSTQDKTMLSNGLCSEIKIENNVIRRVANEYRGSLGICLYYGNDIDIIHNTIYDLPYAGISAGWGWGTADNPDSGLINISKNRIANPTNTLRDSAHIYTLGDNFGSVIEGNYLTGGARNHGNIYTDEGSAHFKITNNISENAAPLWWFVGLQRTHHLSAEHNYTDSAQDVPMRGVASNSITDNIVIENGQWPEEAIQIKRQAGVEAEYKPLFEKSELPSWMLSTDSRTPKNEYAVSVEGWTEAEDYMEGGQFVGYYKLDDVYNNNPYRAEGVQLLANPAGKGYVIHNCFGGEWMKYEVNIKKTATYNLYIKGSHKWTTDPQPKLRFSENDQPLLEDFQVPVSDDWNHIQLYYVGKVYLTEGLHEIKAEFVDQALYFDSFALLTDEQSLSTEVGADPNFDDPSLVLQDDLYPAEQIVKEVNFKDIKGHWAEKNIIEMAQKGIINGRSEEIFAPDDAVSLYEAAWLSYRVLGIKYSDATWKELAKQAGILTDVNEPDRKLSRQEFADVVMKAYYQKKSRFTLTYTEKAFADFDKIAPDYVISVLGIRELGLMIGDENNCFNPGNMITRAEASAVLSRLSSK